MGTLDAFLKGNAKPIEDIEMIVSKRFMDEKGNPIPWILRQLTAKENNNLRKNIRKKLKINWEELKKILMQMLIKKNLLQVL